jgi:hypothetical protein
VRFFVRRSKDLPTFYNQDKISGAAHQAKDHGEEAG